MLLKVDEHCITVDQGYVASERNHKESPTVMTALFILLPVNPQISNRSAFVALVITRGFMKVISLLHLRKQMYAF